MSDDDIVRSMRNTSDEELLAITSWAELGYTDRARAIAEAVLRERRVRLPADLKETRKRGAAAEAEANRQDADLAAEQDQALGRRLSAKLVITLVGGLVFPFFGLRILVLEPLGWAIPIGAAIVAIVVGVRVVRNRRNDAHTERDTGQ